MGLIPTKESLEMASKVNASRFCRRRLPLVMLRNKMAQSLQAAVKFIEQGHVRVGPERVLDPAFLVTRKMEDYVTWTDTSAIKRQIQDYNGMVNNQIFLIKKNQYISNLSRFYFSAMILMVEIIFFFFLL